MSQLIRSTAMESPAPGLTNRTHLRLPIEIRIMIYKCVLTSSTPFVRGSNTKSQKCLHQPAFYPKGFVSYPCANIHSALDLSLLLVSRDTYFESYHLYYALNTVHLCSTGRLFSFLTRIGYARRQQLVSIGFHKFDQDAKRAFVVLRSAGRLEHIKFHLPKQRFPTIPGIAALREVRGLSHVEITSSYDCSDLIAAMKRPRLARYTLKSVDNKEIDLFKQPRERLPKTEAQNLKIDMNWTSGTELCSSCGKPGLGDCRPGENKGVASIIPMKCGAFKGDCVCWGILGQCFRG